MEGFEEELSVMEEGSRERREMKRAGTAAPRSKEGCERGIKKNERREGKDILSTRKDEAVSLSEVMFHKSRPLESKLH